MISRAPTTGFLDQSFSLRLAGLVVVVFLLVGCDDDDDDDRTPVWQEGVFRSSEKFADRCEDPRQGSDPSGEPWPDTRGTALNERNFLRSWSNETYLWYDEITDRNPLNYLSTDIRDYFDLLKTEATTAAGQPKDRFHFTMPTDEWQSQSQSATGVGYGITWAISEDSQGRELFAAYVEDDSPADELGIERGAEIYSIDGERVAYSNDLDTLNEGISPVNSGESHEFEIIPRGNDSWNRETVTLTSEVVEKDPVPVVEELDGTDSNKVGYLLFNDYVATAEEALVDAVNTLASPGVTDLVIDLRYNGGGYLAIASQLAYMIAGPDHTQGQVFENMVFNDKHPDINPVTEEELAPTPFFNQTLGLSVPEGDPLPTLNLSRVFVLTGPDTCSASEALMNGLRGVDVEVIQIGDTTCGKPYGYYPEDNCGTTYFTIQFQGQNAKGFGDYGEGFSPENQMGSAGVDLPGCDAGDDLAHDLGDAQEGRLATALNYRLDDTSCTSSSTSSGTGIMTTSTGSTSSLSALDVQSLKPASQRVKVMRR